MGAVAVRQRPQADRLLREAMAEHIRDLHDRARGYMQMARGALLQDGRPYHKELADAYFDVGLAFKREADTLAAFLKHGD